LESGRPPGIFARPRFRRRRISFFASQKAPQEVLPLPQPSRARATIKNSLLGLRFY